MHSSTLVSFFAHFPELETFGTHGGFHVQTALITYIYYIRRSYLGGRVACGIQFRTQYLKCVCVCVSGACKFTNTYWFPRDNVAKTVCPRILQGITNRKNYVPFVHAYLHSLSSFVLWDEGVPKIWMKVPGPLETIVCLVI